ncbi:hypothetical protein GCM10009837_67390 [Streptomyces durmitorensis]|uniref:Alpha/beta fold hydrolase n=1 Tax=Streptomyces durmitorensis TaxID=319947 RepID=A0ABY4Q7V8_9ACTN|nr:alpha/beta fold hydrolase [Streptomyces durmitorensis]UQT61224.1 alpha/beta fold hydrolase [Streptomyces durmitorensis]
MLERSHTGAAEQGLHHDRGVEPAEGYPHRRSVHRESAGLHQRAGRAGRLLQATQRPFDADAFTYPTQASAWRTIPSWGLVAGRDKTIPPAAERWMYRRAKFRKVVDVPTSSHVVMISHPKTTAKLIEDAAEATR